MSRVRVVSDGSVWIIDDDLSRYCRMPKREGPRAPGPNGEDWGGPDAGELEDLKWHPMVRWELVPELRTVLAANALSFLVDGLDPVFEREPTGRQSLLIHLPDDETCVYAPGAILERA